MNIPWINSFTDNSHSLWDQMRLSGIDMPGKWQCRPTKKRQLDIVKIRLRDGVTILDNGYFGVELTTSGVIWNEPDFSELQSILPSIDPQKAGGGRSPLDIYMPAAALMGVGTVYIAQIVVQPPARGQLTVDIDMVQWFAKPKPFIQGFAGTRNPHIVNGTLGGISPVKPSANTGSKL